MEGQKLFNIEMKCIYYNSFVFSKIYFCLNVWGGDADKHMNRILKLQKRAARIILNADYDTPSVNMFKKLNWMTVSQRFFFQNCILAYKVFNNLSPQYLADILKCKKTIHNYQLRNVLKDE